MFNRIFLAIMVFFVLFIGTGLFLPRLVHVERQIYIDRPPATVFILLNSFRTFPQWSAWAQRDPDMSFENSGPESGVGARLQWRGDPRLVGNGWQEIVESVPSRKVRMSLEFDQQGVAESTYMLAPEGDGVIVIRAFDSDLVAGQGFFGSLLARYFGLFFDEWIGSDYEQGLQNLKMFAESLPATDFSGLDVIVMDVEPVNILYVPSAASQDPGDVAGSLAAAYSEITQFLAMHEIPFDGQPMSITRTWSEEGYDFDAAIPATLPADLELTGNLRYGQSPAGQAVRVTHRGAYSGMAPSYEKLAAYMAVHGLREGRVSWEHYVSDPGSTPEPDLLTYIYFQVMPEGEG